MERTSASEPDLYLIVSTMSPDSREPESNAVFLQSNEDTIYEQDILRDPGSVKPWLSYIEYKQQHGTLYEQAFVSELVTPTV